MDISAITDSFWNLCKAIYMFFVFAYKGFLVFVEAVEKASTSVAKFLAEWPALQSCLNWLEQPDNFLLLAFGVFAAMIVVATLGLIFTVISKLRRSIAKKTRERKVRTRQKRPRSNEERPALSPITEPTDMMEYDEEKLLAIANSYDALSGLERELVSVLAIMGLALPSRDKEAIVDILKRLNIITTNISKGDKDSAPISTVIRALQITESNINTIFDLIPTDDAPAIPLGASDPTIDGKGVSTEVRLACPNINCDRQPDPEDRFCGKCGTSIYGGEQPPLADMLRKMIDDIADLDLDDPPSGNSLLGFFGLESDDIISIEADTGGTMKFSKCPACHTTEVFAKGELCSSCDPAVIGGDINRLAELAERLKNNVSQLADLHDSTSGEDKQLAENTLGLASGLMGKLEPYISGDSSLPAPANLVDEILNFFSPRKSESIETNPNPASDDGPIYRGPICQFCLDDVETSPDQVCDTCFQPNWSDASMFDDAGDLKPKWVAAKKLADDLRDVALGLTETIGLTEEMGPDKDSDLGKALSVAIDTYNQIVANHHKVLGKEPAAKAILANAREVLGEFQGKFEATRSAINEEVGDDYPTKPDDETPDKFPAAPSPLLCQWCYHEVADMTEGRCGNPGCKRTDWYNPSVYDNEGRPKGTFAMNFVPLNKEEESPSPEVILPPEPRDTKPEAEVETEPPETRTCPQCQKAVGEEDLQCNFCKVFLPEPPMTPRRISRLLDKASSVATKLLDQGQLTGAERSGVNITLGRIVFLRDVANNPEANERALERAVEEIGRINDLLGKLSQKSQERIDEAKNQKESDQDTTCTFCHGEIHTDETVCPTCLRATTTASTEDLSLEPTIVAVMGNSIPSN